MKKRKVYQLAKVNEQSSLRGQNGENIAFPKERAIPTTDRIYIEPELGEEYGKVIDIRFCRNDKEIFVDKQSPSAKKGSITAKRGFVFANESEVTKMKYLDICNYNGSNPNRDTSKPVIFFEVKEGEMAKDELKARFRLGEVYQMVETMHPEKVRALCEILDLNSVSNSIDDLRYELIAYAERNIDGFYNVLQSDDTEVKMVIAKAFKLQYLYRSGQHIKMSPSNRVVLAITSNKVMDELFDFFMSNKGKETFAQLKARIETPALIPSKEEEVEEIMSSESTGITSKYEAMSISKLFDLAVEGGSITRKGPWFKFGEANLGKNKNEACSTFEENEELLHDLRTKLMIEDRAK